MARIKVTPIPESGIEPFELSGELTSKYFDDCGLIYYIAGRSFSANIVTVLDEVQEDSP